MGPIRWFKELRYIVRNYSSEIRRLAALENELRSRTDIHADIAWTKRSSNCIIIAGRYRNKDFVQVFDVHVDTLAEMVELLRRWEKQYGHVRTLDAPPGFKACFEHQHEKDWGR